MNDLRMPFQVLCITLAFAPGCVINEGGDDDGLGDSGAGDDGSGGADDAAADGASAADDGANDETGAGDAADDGAGDRADDGGAADGPSSGTWLYDETGGTTNDCTFLDDPSNGFGEYEVVADGPGGFTIIPGDDSDLFQCTHDGGAFECAERLQDDIIAGGTTLQVLVSITGDLESASAMSGTQDGRIVCEGTDCPTAEALLGTTFPCEFSIPWQGSKL